MEEKEIKFDVSPENFQKISTGLEDKERKIILESVKKLRKMLQVEKDPPLQEAIDANCVPKLVGLLNNIKSTTEIKYEAAWCLTNIASGDSEQTLVVIYAGAVQILIKMLEHEKDEQVLEQIIWALGNIIGDSPIYREYVINQGIIDHLIRISEEEHGIFLERRLIWAISNVIRGKPKPNISLVKKFIPVFTKYINTKYDQLATHLLWSISYFTDNSFEGIQLIINSGLVKYIIPRLYSNEDILIPALRTIGNFVTGDQLQTNLVLSYGILVPYKELLSHPTMSIQKEVCWGLSNIISGDQSHIQCVINAGIFPLIFKILKTKDNPLDLKKEALYVLVNALTGSSKQQYRYFMSLEVIDTLLIKFENDVMIDLCLSDGDDENKFEFITKGGISYIKSLKNNHSGKVQRILHSLNVENEKMEE